MSAQAYRHDVRVYVAETDVSGVVYHANYLKFFERGRVELFRDKGIDFGALLKKSDIFFAIRDLELTYQKPARLDDELTVITQINQVRGASLRYNQRIILRGDPEEVICTAKLSVAFVDSDIKPVAIPKWLRQEIEK